MNDALLDIRAGPVARQYIERHGLTPAAVRAVAGAAGGPKWLILGGLDRWLFGDWLQGPGPAVELVGSSIGAWRFAMACSPLKAAARITALESAYIEQCYSSAPTRDEITRTTHGILDHCMDESVLGGVLEHPRFRLTAITARGRGPAAAEGRLPLGAAGIVAATLNLARRSWLALLFERVLFQSPQAKARFAMDRIATRRVALSRDNAADAIYASGSIPLLMAGVRDPAGAPRGCYRDGGIVDYHIDQPLTEDGVVLMPHFATRVTPGWFDKWARRHPRFTGRLVLVGPGPGLLARLPHGRVPDRQDFRRYAGNDDARIRDWRQAVGEGERFAEAFARTLDHQSLAAEVRPLAMTHQSIY